MTRIEPDDNDLVVWKLDDTGSTFVNSSTSTQVGAPGTGANLTLTNTVGTGYLGIVGNAVRFFGGETSNSVRNTLSGASTFTPAFPITISCWIKLFAYTNNGFDFGNIISKTLVTGGWSGSITAFDLFIDQNSNAGRWYIELTTTGTGRVSQVTFSNNNRLPLGIWTHLGMTYDGSTLNGYLNGNQVLSQAVTGAINYGSNGPWLIGAIPSTPPNNKYEPNMLIQDVRVANVARPLSYFKEVHRAAFLPQEVSSVYYKLRAYDLGAPTPTPVTWVDNQISFLNAPTPPFGGPYGDLEVIDSWR